MIATMCEPENDSTTRLTAETEVVINGITFEDGKLWKARYPSLIDYSQVLPGYQMEPALQITSSKLPQMTVRLGLAEGFVFQGAGGDVKLQWVDGNGSPPPSCISAALQDPRTCLVKWTREAGSPSAIALRIFCRPAEGPEPTDPESVNEGGVYLTFVVREEVWPEEIIEFLKQHPRPGSSEPAPVQEDADRMKVHALLLPEGQVRYEGLFKQSAPEGTELELAFRVRRGSVLGFDVEITNHGFVYRAKSGSPEEVAREIIHPDPAEPRVRTELETRFGDSKSICRVTWTSGQSDDESGLSCSFNLIAQLAAGQQPSFRPVDPTIIEPPRCMNGVCIPPTRR